MTTVSFPGFGLSFQLNRVAFTVNGFEIFWYGIILSLALVIGIIYSIKKCAVFGVDDDKFLDLAIVGTVMGVIGGRLYYVVFSAPEYYKTFKDIINVRDGGLGFYGVVIFAVISCLIMCRIRNVKLFPVLDMLGLGFMMGQSVGRWANFINQEAFGCNTTLPWGMTSGTVQNYLMYSMESLAEKGIAVDPLQPVHPTFLYESLWLLIGFIIFNAYIKSRKFDGEIFLMYLVWNGAGRAVIEGLRTDSLYWGDFRVSQLLGGLCAAAALAAVLVIRAKLKKDGENAKKPDAQTEEWAEELKVINERKEKEKNKTKKLAETLEAGENEAVESENADSVDGTDGEE